MGISIWQLLIVLAIVLLLFGTKRLRSLGGDLGGAIKGFRKAVQDTDKDAKKETDSTILSDKETVINVQSKEVSEQEKT